MIYKLYNFELLPYGAILDVVCTSSSKKNRNIIVDRTSSITYSITTGDIGVGDSYFMESMIEPMTMEFTVNYSTNNYNGELISISTNLQCSNIESEYNPITGNNVIKKFTISNEEYFNEPFDNEIVYIYKKINRVKIQLDNPLNHTYSFKNSSNETISYDKELSKIYDGIFYFSTDKVYVGEEITIKYYILLEEEISEYSSITPMTIDYYKYNCAIVSSPKFASNTLRVYKENKEEEISILNGYLEDKILIFNINNIEENEKLSVHNLISPSISLKKEILDIQYNGNKPYIKLLDYWTEILEINNFEKNGTINIQYYNSSYNRVQFLKTVVNLGELVLLKYTSVEGENIQEILTTQEFSSYYVVYPSFKAGNNTLIAYHIKKTQITNFTTNLNEKIIEFDENENINYDTIEIKYNSFLTKEEYKDIENNNTSYIELSDYWINNPEIYKYKKNNELTKDNYEATYVRFRKSVIGIGQHILLDYTTTTNENIREILVVVEHPTLNNYNIVYVSKQPKRFNLIKAYSLNCIKIDNFTTNLNEKIIEFDESETVDYDFIGVKYDYPILKKEAVTIEYNDNDNSYYGILSEEWEPKLFNQIKAYKINKEISENISLERQQNIAFPKEIIGTDDTVLLKYQNEELITEIHEAIEADEKVTYEGEISDENKDRDIVKCLDFENTNMSYTKEGKRLIVDNPLYDHQPVTLYFKKEQELPYIKLCCNNVKIECCFVNPWDGKGGDYCDNGYGGLTTTDEGITIEDDILQPFSNYPISNWCRLSRHITVSWDKSENNGNLFKGQRKNDGHWYQGWFSYGDINGNIIDFDASSPVTGQRLWSVDQSATLQNHNFNLIVPPLNGTGNINGIIPYNYFKIGYTINFHGEPEYNDPSKLYVNNNEINYYDEDGFMYTGKVEEQLISKDGTPSIIEAPLNGIWSTNSKFYITQEGKYISPSSGVEILSEWEESLFCDHICDNCLDCTCETYGCVCPDCPNDCPDNYCYNHCADCPSDGDEDNYVHVKEATGGTYMYYYDNYWHQGGVARVEPGDYPIYDYWAPGTPIFIYKGDYVKIP